MTHQKGFIPVLLIILIVVGIAAAGGGYVIYKNKQQETNRETINNSQNSQLDTQNETGAKTQTSSNAPTKINCDNNWQCLISATNQCSAAIGVFTYSDVPHPYSWLPFLFSGKTSYEIKKSGNECSFVQSYIERTVTYKPESRQQMISQGNSNQEIDASLADLNDMFAKSAPVYQVCSGNPSDLSFLFTSIMAHPEVIAASDLSKPAEKATAPSGGVVSCDAMKNTH